MAASFPSNTKTWTPVADNTDNILAAHINDAYAEIVAIETHLLSDTNRVSLIPETITKLQSGLDVLIDVVGDSITLGIGATDATCYVALFADYLAVLYPDSTVIRYDGVCEVVHA